MPYRNPYLSYNYQATKEGLNFHVRNRAGVRQFGSGYSEVAIQEALDSLKNARRKAGQQEKVKLEKDFHSIGATLEVEDYTIVELIGQVTLADGVNDDILRNKVSGDDNITVRGGYWYGNRANQSAGRGFEFIGTSGNHCTHIRVEHLRLFDIEDEGVYYYYCWSSKVLDTAVTSCGDDAFHFYNFVDSRALQLACSATNGRGLYLSGGSCAAFSNLYLGGTTNSGEAAQLYIHGLDNTQWSNIRVDNPASNGVKIENSTIQNIFNGLTITTSSNPADNTKDALVLDGNANYNVFNGFYIGKKRPEFDDWRYGVNEITADYNSYSGGVIRNCQTGRTTGLGGNTKWDTSSIIEA